MRTRLAPVALMIGLCFLFDWGLLRGRNVFLSANLLGALVSLAVSTYARHGNPQHLFGLGLAFEVFTAFIVSLIEHSNPEQTGFLGVSWAAFVILAFPVILEAPPRATAAVSMVAALVSPLAYKLTQSPGEPDVMSLHTFPLFFSNFVAGGLAVAQSHFLQKLKIESEPPRDLGAYRLQEKLGEGGMGEVWRAHHRGLAREAAVKLIPPELLTGDKDRVEEFVLRFQREARTTAHLTSVNTVTLYDYGMAPDGTLYYVMELLKGIDMEDLVRVFGPVPANRVVHFLRQACLSLAEAHQAGLVHRDIKPANLQVCTLGLDYDVVKVLDFGLVSAPKTPEKNEKRLTAKNSVFGTIGYMSPEQASGDEVGPPTDMYALGCVANYLLTGHSIFRAKTGQESYADLFMRIPDPPSSDAPHPVPPELDRLVLACLEKSPDKRPSALELEEALARIVLDPPWRRADAKAWWAENLPEGKLVHLA